MVPVSDSFNVCIDIERRTGHQPDVADYYSNSGSMYLLPLGLPASHPFWSAPFTSWTMKKAWNGEPFGIDHAISF